VAGRLGLDRLDDAQWMTHFGRLDPLPGAQPLRLALRYHGHQFRTYNPDLGDGRGFLLAQLREAPSGRLSDLSTKGSGRTPYSRGGDGRLTLKGGVREALATAMLEALGAPTSDTLSLIETGEALQRSDEPSPTRACVLVRRTYSSIRFGTFQRHAFHERTDLLLQLTRHVLAVYHPDLAQTPDPAAALLGRVVERAAELTAGWMLAGFVHGVLNTDNMNINGESFDYGPYRFLPRNDPNFVAAYFDQNGLYAFGRQPEAVFWNLNQLAGALSLVGADEALAEQLNRFSTLYREAMTAGMLRRLGLKSSGAAADQALAQSAFRALSMGGDELRWEPFFFDWFCGLASEGRALSGPRAALYAQEAFLAFRARLAGFEADRVERLVTPYFERSEPEDLLLPEIEAVWRDIAEGDDWTAFQQKLAAIDVARRAYDFPVQR
jgi:uncharacterized protein YdiU (UPF0061 family)